MKETIFYKRTEYTEKEYKLQIDPINCFMKSYGENNAGYKYIGVLPRGKRFVLIKMTDTMHGAEIRFHVDKEAYISRLDYQKFAQQNASFTIISKEEFIKALEDRFDWHTDNLFQLNLDN